MQYDIDKNIDETHKQFCLKYLGYSIYHCKIYNNLIMRIKKDIITSNEEDFDFYFHKSERASAIIYAMLVVEALIDEKDIDYFNSMYKKNNLARSSHKSENG